MTDMLDRDDSMRSPGPSIQDILARDGDAPEKMRLDQPEFPEQEIPFSRYTSREFFDAEMKNVWAKSWQWVCREEHIPDEGDYIVYDVGPYSLIVIRIEDGGVKAFRNSCLHRGTKLRSSGTEGSAKNLRCPFHGWTWEISGKLKDIPCRWDFPQVKDEDYSLPEVQVGRWGGFVFINMDADAPPLLEWLEVVPDHFSNFFLEDRYVALHLRKELPCNWKLGIEAFIEAYHVLETHPQLMSSGTDVNCQYDIFGRHTSRFVAAHGVTSPLYTKALTEQEIFDSLIAGRPTLSAGDGYRLRPDETARAAFARLLKEDVAREYGQRWANYSTSEMIDTLEYFIFPNMFFFYGATIPFVYRFRPIGDQVDRTLFEILLLLPVGEGKDRPEPAEPAFIGADESYGVASGVGPAMALVFDQDTGNLRAQQEGCYVAEGGSVTLANYQESRIRKFHETLMQNITG